MVFRDVLVTIFEVEEGIVFGKFLYVRVVLCFTLYTTLNLRSPFYSNITLLMIKLVVDHSSYRLTLRNLCILTLEITDKQIDCKDTYAH